MSTREKKKSNKIKASLYKTSSVTGSRNKPFYTKNKKFKNEKEPRYYIGLVS